LADENKQPEEKQEKSEKKQSKQEPKKIEQETPPKTEHTEEPEPTPTKTEKIPEDTTDIKPDTSDEKQIDVQPVITDDPAKPPEVKKPIEATSPDKKVPKKGKKGKDDVPDDFQYIVRIANTDINGDYCVEFGLAQIKGVGRRLACLIADAASIKRSFKMGNLTDTQIKKIRDVLMKIDEIAPSWMLNHRKDYDTGKNVHLISAQVELSLRDDVNLLKKIRSYRGIRHESGLPTRGQRTRANSRSGLTLGVSKKKQ
jgi:small subunit ribosomal protein S13